MAIRLSGAQVTRIKEIIANFTPRDYHGIDVTPHYIVEDLVEQILKEVVPECNPSEHLTPKEQRSVSI